MRLHDPLGALVYCHDRHPAAYVMVNGEITVSEGKLVRIKRKKRSAIKQIWLPLSW